MSSDTVAFLSRIRIEESDCFCNLGVWKGFLCSFQTRL